MSACKLDGCPKISGGSGYCRMHKTRIDRHGSPYVRLPNGKPREVPETIDLYVPFRPENDCWIWQGHKDKRGYGRIQCDGRQRFAHRVVYKHLGNELNDEQVLRHSCDNPPCVNPDHLLPGTDADNIRDMVSRGRNARGSTHRSSKVAEAQVMEMRRLYATGEITQSELGARFGLTPTPISQLLRGVTWKHLPLVERQNRG